jgi:hypothetical protein
MISIPRRFRASSALASVAIAGCARPGGDAMLRPVCAPNDAAAVMLQVPGVADAEHPYFRLRIERPLGQVARTHVVVRDPDAAGPSAEWCGADGCSVVRSGATTADFGAMRGDSSVPVHLRSARPDGTRFEWSGVARWKGETLVCG